MVATVIDGRARAERLRAEVAEGVARFREQAGRAPGLAVVLVGEDSASRVYVAAKEKATLAVGMAGSVNRLPTETSEADLLGVIARLNADDAVDAILVQLPLPAHIDETAITAAVDPDKDVDGFHPLNAGRLATGLPGPVPCTPLGCLLLLKEQLGDLSGLDAIVIGRSNIVGKPMALLLLAENCTVTIAHSRTRDLPALVARADIVVAAAGRPRLVGCDWIKRGATVIDVGINRVDGKLVGDVNYENVIQIAGAITPVPGGVGPMTIAVLLANTLEAARRRAGLSTTKEP